MRIVLLIAVMITFTVIANLLMKTGAVLGRDAGGSWISQVLHWRIVGGLACFAAGAIVYIVVLRTLPLNVAQSFAAAQFIAVILASALVLSEPIGAAQWIGILLIACGIAIVGWSNG
jgi:undecaprenyl phosphate-alpha-L-ara4N flippase subunit ArnE